MFVMDTEKAYYSDTLERSNVSSLQSDNSSKKSSDLNSTNVDPSKIQNCFCYQHTLGNLNFIPCPVLNLDPTYCSGLCHCKQLKPNENNLQKQHENINICTKWQHLNFKWPRRNFGNKKDKLYEVKSKNRKSSRCEKPFPRCDTLEGVHLQQNCGLKNVVENSIKYKSNSERDNAEKIEIYYFDHGNSAYYHTTDMPPILKTEKIAEKTNSKVTKILAEIFGIFHLIASTLTTIILQFLRFILFSLVRPLTVGVIQLVADYFIKPLLTITFNGLIQPVLILLYNMATSIRDCCEPLATTLGYYIKEVAILVRSCRLIEITHNYNSNSNTRYLSEIKKEAANMNG